jgi:hypothetical protein
MRLWANPPEAEVAQSYYYRHATTTLTLTIETQELDAPPVLDRRPYCWEGLEDAAGHIRPPSPPPPPLTAEQAEAQRAAAAAFCWNLME